MPTTQTCPPFARQKIESWEGLVLYTYDDADGHYPHRPFRQGMAVRGTLTIGYGTTGKDAAPGRTITRAQADEMLTRDLHKFEQAVSSLVTVALTENQFGALCSFVYNVGRGAFAKSQLLKKLNAGQYEAVPAELLKWTHSGGKLNPGLVTRRNAEIGLWNAGTEEDPTFIASNTVLAKPPSFNIAQAKLLAPAFVALGTGAQAAIAQLTPFADAVDYVKWAVIGLTFVAAIGALVAAVVHETKATS